MNMKEKGNYCTANAEDYKGFPADKSKTGGWIASALILGIELCERLSTMGIAVNLVTYLSGTMHLSSAVSANIVTDFMGTAFLLCLFGGFLADSFLGRYKTITIFTAIQILGTILLTITTILPELRPPPCSSNTTCKPANRLQMAALYVALYVIAVGTGGLKSSVSGFGSDQFDENDDKERSYMILFFSRFFFFISLGTLLAVTVLVYIQDNVGRSWGYGICSIAMFIAISIFLAGTRRYRFKKCTGSPIVQIMQVVMAATKKRKVQISADNTVFYEDTEEHARIQRTDQFRFLNKAAVVPKEGEKYDLSVKNPWILCSVTKVEEVKMMMRLLPIWATTIIFWTVYAQLITFSVEQASTLQRYIGSFQIPAGSLTVFFVAAILITLAVYDRLIIPFLKRWKGKPGFSNLQRIGIGLFLSAFGMVAAALVETKRLSVAKRHGQNTTTLPLSVFILIPQFFLVGSGEAFIYSGQLDFFITQSPKGMKTMSTALFLTTLSLGFFLSSLLVTIVGKLTTLGGGKGWVGGHTINHGRLDLFFGLLSILSFIDFAVYLYCASWYKPLSNEKNLQMKNVTSSKSGNEDNC